MLLDLALLIGHHARLLPTRLGQRRCLNVYSVTWHLILFEGTELGIMSPCQQGDFYVKVFFCVFFFVVAFGVLYEHL